MTKQEWLKLPDIAHPLQYGVKYKLSQGKWSSGNIGYFTVKYNDKF